MDTGIMDSISGLKDERLAIDREYADRLKAFREKLVATFIQTKDRYGLDELMLIPLTPNGYQLGSWECREDIDSDFECDQADLVDASIAMLAYGGCDKSFDKEEVKVITRLGIIKGGLWFHTAEYTTHRDGDLSFGTLQQDNWQAPWLPISEYKDSSKLINLMLAYLSQSGNWEFTKNHPECRFLHRKLDSQFIKQRIKENNGKDDLSGLFNSFFQLKKIDLAGLDASAAETLQAMFYHCHNLTDISLAGFDSGRCESFESMFDGCAKLKSIDVSPLNTACAITMQEMFRGCRSLQALDLSTFDTRQCENVSMMFMDCKKLCEIDLSNWDLSSLDCSIDMFEGCKKLSRIYLRNVNRDTFEAIKEAVEAAKLKDVEIIAEIRDADDEQEVAEICDDDHTANLDLTVGKNLLACKFKNLSTATTLDFNGLDTSGVVDGEEMFTKCKHLETIDLHGLDFSNIRNLKYAFRACKFLKSVSFGGIDTSMVTDWKWMFSGCTSLKDVDMTGIDTSRLLDWRGMFSECENLKELNLSGLDVSCANDMAFLFFCCRNLEALDLSGWNLYMFPMDNSTFTGCVNIKTIILRGCNEATVQHLKEILSQQNSWGEYIDISHITFITE